MRSIVFVGTLILAHACASQPKTAEYMEARTACETAAAPARGLMLATIYNHCMQSKGYK